MRDRFLLLAVLASILFGGITLYLATSRSSAHYPGATVELLPRQSIDSRVAPDLPRFGVPPLERQAQNAPAASHSNDTVHWSVLVVNFAGAIVADATVTAIDHQNNIIGRGVSDAEGELILPLPLTAVSVTLVASAEGLSAGTHVLPPTSEGVQRVVLDDVASIEGYVSLKDGGRPPPGTTVYAWTSVSDPAPAAFSAPLLAEVPLLSSASVGEDGRFVLKGISSSKHHTIAAGANGWTCLQPARRVKAGGIPVRLVLSRVYGCVVEALLPDGTVPSASRSFTVERVTPDRDDLTPLKYPSLALSLSGVTNFADLRGSRFYDWRQHLVAVAMPYEVPQIAGFGLIYEVVGIERSTVTFSLLPYSTSFARTTAILRPTAIGLGSLNLIMENGLRIQDTALDGAYSTARIEFIPLVDGASAFYVPIAHVRNGAELIEGIPIGRYRVRFVSPFGWAFPRDPNEAVIEILRTGSEWRLPIDSLGALRLISLNPSLLSRSRILSYSLRRNGRTAVYNGRLGPPYVLSGIPAGDYVATLSAIGSTPSTEVGPLTVRIEPGKVSDAKFEWPPDD